MGKILVVAEKPSAGADMARVLACTQKHKGYIEGDKYIVTWALGHLVGLKNPEEHDISLKAWKLDTLPFRFPMQSSLKVLPSTAGQFSVIKKLINRPDVDYLINAGDAGREGYLIQEWIYWLAGNRKPVKVLWASSLTEEALKKAFANLHERSEFQTLLAEAEARASADWMMGMNYSRGLTLTKGQGKTLLRYGRCQTSLLNLIVKRESEIKEFKPTPYYEIWRTYAEGFSGVLIRPDGKPAAFLDKEKAETFLSTDQSDLLTVASYKKELKKVPAPALFNLADLQKEMGSKYGFDAEKTLSLAQSLYEKYKLLSYPRTDSRAMSTDLAAEIGKHIDSVLPLLTKDPDAFPLRNEMAETIRRAIPSIQTTKKYVNDLKVTDHHALVPTINKDTSKIYFDLGEDERKVFAAVVKRFLAIFLPEYQYVSVELIALTQKRYAYKSKGKTVLSLGWKELYAAEQRGQHEKANDDDASEETIPAAVRQASQIHTKAFFRKDKITQAPPRYSVSSIISLMEKYGIGTSATRAEIIKKLMNPKSQYVTLSKGKYFATELGAAYISLIPDELKKETLTADFEAKLAKIEAGALKRADFLDEIYAQIAANLEVFKKGGRNLDESLQSSRDRPLAGIEIRCPKCGKPVYKGKYGWFCSGYKAGCKISIPKEIAHKQLTEPQARQLLEEGSTGMLKGFKKKDGGTFSAKLILQDDGKVAFKFDGKKGR